MSLSYNIYDGEKQRSAKLNAKIKELKNKKDDKKAAAELRTFQTMVVRKHRTASPPLRRALRAP